MVSAGCYTGMGIFWASNAAWVIFRRSGRVLKGMSDERVGWVHWARKKWNV